MISHFETKIAEIFEKSAKKVAVKWNLARKKMFFALVFSTITLRNVHFTELALKVNPDLEAESNLRRIQMFFADYETAQIIYDEVFLVFSPFSSLKLGFIRCFELQTRNGNTIFWLS